MPASASQGLLHRAPTAQVPSDRVARDPDLTSNGPKRVPVLLELVDLGIPCLAARVGSQMQPVGTRGWQPWFCGGFSLLHSLLPSGCGLDRRATWETAVLAGEQPVERHPQVRQEMEAICHLHRSRCGLLSGFGVGTTAISTDEGDSG